MAEKIDRIYLTDGGLDGAVMTWSNRKTEDTDVAYVPESRLTEMTSAIQECITYVNDAAIVKQANYEDNLKECCLLNQLRTLTEVKS